MRRLAALVLALFVVLGGCAKKDDRGQQFSYDLAGGISSLDPQFAQSEASRIVIQNSFEGLLRFSATGEVEKGVAQTMTVSNDGKTYDFTLSPDARWSNGSAVTADDFLFAFERLFSPTTPSPYAGDFLCIENAAAVMAGELPLSALGIRVSGERRIIFTLTEANAFFPSLMASGAAMPCARAFFTEQRGRYGLEASTLLTNGPFIVKRWDARQILLEASGHYSVPIAAESVQINLSVADAEARFREGTTDFFIGSGELRFGDSYSRADFYDKAYLLIFNQRQAPYDSADVRKALISAIDMQALTRLIGEGRLPADGILPPATALMEHGYRDFVGLPKLPILEPDPRTLLFAAYETLGIAALPQTELLLTESVDMPIGSLLQQVWQQKLSAYINIRPVTPGELTAEVQRGSFQLAILAATGVDASPYGILQALGGREGDNLTGGLYEGMDALITSALAATSPQQAANAYLAAEELILGEFAVWPIYYAATSFVSAPGVQGACYLPQNGMIYFRDALRG